MQNNAPKPTQSIQTIQKNSNVLVSVLFGITALIYFATAIYTQYFTKNPETGNFNSDVALGIIYIGIAATFWVSNKSIK
jgi:hypothetical protein